MAMHCSRWAPARRVGRSWPAPAAAIKPDCRLAEAALAPAPLHGIVLLQGGSAVHTAATCLLAFCLSAVLSVVQDSL